MKINNDAIVNSFFKGLNKDSKFNIKINDLENTLNIPNKMLSELIDDKGWLFIIKCNSLIEISLNTSIIKVLNQPKLESIITRLDTSSSIVSKVSFADKLDLLKKEQIVFIKLLAEIRNIVIHDISKINFSFNEYLTAFKEKNQRKAFLKKLTSTISKNETVDVNDFFNKLDMEQIEIFIKYLFYMNVIGIITQLDLISTKKQEISKEMEEIITKLSKIKK